MFARTALTRSFLVYRRPVAVTPFILSIRNLFIQTAETPNEQALKFLPLIQILGENQTKEFLSGREAACSPLAVKLFSIDGIKSVMFGSDFITIEKSNNTDWSLLKPEIFSILTEYLTNGLPVLLEGAADSAISDDMAFDEDDDEVVSMIKELIFTRIRPAIQDDGGDIEFVSFEPNDGTVFLKLKGACRSCDSSSVTLKNGIESMLKHYIEEVNAVEPIEEDEAAVDAIVEEAKLSPQAKRGSNEESSHPPSL
ncbi:NFU1 iron-sulfur cluster scaffold, mitochondrial [Candida viswanathii]|uniref:NFU1 iron-sulfur cluster scaffold, mitochondrial n=1 Tax=Candida viswanathii TaxID=5486 RepID=A0A367XWC5_9ASCO|nr:NFU1 iron-sulfur cluster scaffold, mitochondrial [Candida viswanathii]